MLPGIFPAVFLSTCLTIFFIVNVFGLVRKAGTNRKNVDFKAEIELPYGIALALATLGTGMFFLLSVLYAFLLALELDSIVGICLTQLRFPLDSWVQLLGMAMTAIGYILFLWSVLARGKYATSWEMPSDQKLVTWGPYRYVRHPSYLAYFILFAGLFLLLLDLVALVPFVAVPGYACITTIEDEMLRKRFGEVALEYQRKTGRFLPRRRRQT